MAEPHASDKHEAEPLVGGRMLAAISNELVMLHARFYGRGPTKARTLMVEDIVICRLADPFTTAERTLLQVGRQDEVRRMRAAFQYEMKEQFTEIVQRLTRRRVIGFISEIHVNPDMAVELFFLEPVDGPRAARDDNRDGDGTEPDASA